MIFTVGEPGKSAEWWSESRDLGRKSEAKKTEENGWQDAPGSQRRWTACRTSAR